MNDVLSHFNTNQYQRITLTFKSLTEPYRASEGHSQERCYV
jgi:hypothetical protein